MLARFTWPWTRAILLLLVLTACGGAPQTGSLLVVVSGLPVGVDAAITVTGPGGYSVDVSGSQALTGLVPGSYAIEARRVHGSGAIVPPAFAVADAPTSVTVPANDAAEAVVTYAAAPGSGRLWVSSDGADVLLGFDAADVVESGTPDPAAAIAQTDHSGTRSGVAVDRDGNIWVAYAFESLVAMYASADLGSGGAVAPAVLLAPNAGSLDQPVALAFDAAGGLWVSNRNGDGLSYFAPEQLTESGDPQPATTIDTVTGTLLEPTGIAFDHDGTLWVANEGADTLVAFTPAQLAAGGEQVPTVTISAAADGLAQPTGIAFDADGWLWVANYSEETVVAFTPAQLAASGAPEPTVTITDTTFTTGRPQQLAFDHDGGLWVGLTAPTGIVRIAAPGDLGPGSVTPPLAAEFDLPAGFNTSLAFLPTPPAVPLEGD
jgi:sugar lactone lactonase YvrE